MRKSDPGARLEPAQAAAATAGEKAMMPIRGDVRFLDYLLSSLADAGVEEVCLVVAPGAEAIRARYAKPSRLSIAFAEQPEPAGSAAAVVFAEEFAGDDDFLALNSDNYYPASAFRSLLELGEPGLPVFDREQLAQRSNFPPERAAQYAILEVGDDGYLSRIVEKPGPAEMPAGRTLVSMNLWRFRKPIFAACRAVAPGPQGEKDLPRAVDFAISNRLDRFRTVFCGDGVLDLSMRSDVALVAERLREIEVRV
jgi:glucose-1-phosphate thymidylyltransferase